MDSRWHPDRAPSITFYPSPNLTPLLLVTKAFVYQNTHGLYPDAEFPSKTFIDLGAKFHTLDDFVRERLAPVFSQDGQRAVMMALEEAKNGPVIQRGLAKL